MATFVSPDLPSSVKLLHFTLKSRVDLQVYPLDQYVPPVREKPTLVKQEWKFYITGKQTGSDGYEYDDGEFVLEIEFDRGPATSFVSDLTKLSVYSHHPAATDVVIDRIETVGTRTARVWFSPGQTVTRMDSDDTYYVRADDVDDGFGGVFSVDSFPLELNEKGDWVSKEEQVTTGNDMNKAVNFFKAGAGIQWGDPPPASAYKVPETLYGGDDLGKLLPAVLRSFGFEFERMYGRPATRTIKDYAVISTTIDVLGNIKALGATLTLETCLDFPKKGGDIFIDGHRFTYSSWSGPKKDGTYEIPVVSSIAYAFMAKKISANSFVVLDAQELRPEFETYPKPPIDSPWSGVI